MTFFRSPVTIIDHSMHRSVNKIEVDNSVGLKKWTCEVAFPPLSLPNTLHRRRDLTLRICLDTCSRERYSGMIGVGEPFCQSLRLFKAQKQNDEFK